MSLNKVELIGGILDLLNMSISFGKIVLSIIHLSSPSCLENPSVDGIKGITNNILVLSGFDTNTMGDVTLSS